MGGDSRGKSPKPSPPPTTVVATASAGGATPGGAAPGNQVLVQFMWQPLTQMSYPKVTLLTSLGVRIHITYVAQSSVEVCLCLVWCY